MIQVTGLTKYFGSLRAIHDVSFQVDRGEVVGFLGPNGAGKTTTLRVLTGYHPASSGVAKVAGFDVFAESVKARSQVGYLPENTPLYPEMRVREYLQFRARLKGVARSKLGHQIDHVAERCWLGEFIDRPIGQLSKGCVSASAWQMRWCMIHRCCFWMNRPLAWTLPRFGRREI